jgi:methyl-accepting chemotaxis protein
VEEVNSISIQQDVSIHRIAEQSDDILGLSQKLFGEISKFRITEDETHEEQLINIETTDEPRQLVISKNTDTHADEALESAALALEEERDTKEETDKENTEQENSKKLVTV